MPLNTKIIMRKLVLIIGLCSLILSFSDETELETARATTPATEIITAPAPRYVKINDLNFIIALRSANPNLLQAFKGDSLEINHIAVGNTVFLDISSNNIVSLQGLEYFKNLKTLICRQNNLTYLDISKNTKLKELFCSYNKLTTLDITQNVNLEVLGCIFNKLTTLDITQNVKLESLYCSINELTTLDISKNPLLIDLDCRINKLTTLDISKNPLLISPSIDADVVVIR